MGKSQAALTRPDFHARRRKTGYRHMDGGALPTGRAPARSRNSCRWYELTLLTPALGWITGQHRRAYGPTDRPSSPCTLDTEPVPGQLASARPVGPLHHTRARTRLICVGLGPAKDRSKCHFTRLGRPARRSAEGTGVGHDGCRRRAQASRHATRHPTKQGQGSKSSGHAQRREVRRRAVSLVGRELSPRGGGGTRNRAPDGNHGQRLLGVRA